MIITYFVQVKNGSYEEPYTDPGAPVHIVTGAAVSILYTCLCAHAAIKADAFVFVFFMHALPN